MNVEVYPPFIIVKGPRGRETSINSHNLAHIVSESTGHQTRTVRAYTTSGVLTFMIEIHGADCEAKAEALTHELRAKASEAGLFRRG